MADNSWRKELNLVVEENLNDLIRETKEYDYAIRMSSDKSKAQMWVAMALVNAKMNRLMIELGAEKPKIPKDELDKILKTLEKF